MLVGSISVDAIARSPLVRSLVQQLTAQLGDGALPARVAFDKWIGSGTTRRVSFSITGSDAALFLLEGRVDPKDLEQWSKRSNLQMVRLDAERLLVGNSAAVTAALARWRVPSRPETDLIREGRTFAAASDLWISAGGPAMALSGLLPETPKGFAVGVSLRDGLRVNVGIDAGSAKAAREMLIKIEERLAAETTEGTTTSARVEGNLVRVDVAVETQVLKEALAARFSPELRHQVNALVESQKPKQKKAMIYGLDNGPREVILSRP